MNLNEFEALYRTQAQQKEAPVRAELWQHLQKRLGTKRSFMGYGLSAAVAIIGLLIWLPKPLEQPPLEPNTHSAPETITLQKAPLELIDQKRTAQAVVTKPNRVIQSPLSIKKHQAGLSQTVLHSDPSLSAFMTQYLRDKKLKLELEKYRSMAQAELEEERRTYEATRLLFYLENEMYFESTLKGKLYKLIKTTKDKNRLVSK
ncbi:MAG: hypothetical protein O2914_04910 [Bacteroidetes bacterium]|nr:hypothetical protein [Bacteroidota bacterium]MDA0938156.1 hypothetical protein [Bacteroidota bacterium]MDA1344504.1 hypothetical protein [Bacteroidota bacterium]